MALQVIGTGFGRTGTDSMREALTILGFGPCHHMIEVMEAPGQKQRWRALAAGGEADWEHLFDGYASCVDWPSAHYWRELVAAYPQAQVILTWRDPESWWKSFSATILKNVGPGGDSASLGRALIGAQVFGGRAAEREHAIATYRANVEAVMREVPPGRLLVHRLGDGWAPLCAHLGVPVPDVVFPHINSSEDFKRMVAGASGQMSPQKAGEALARDAARQRDRR